jgi:hypothetical protein
MFLVFWLMLWAVIEKSLEDLVLLNPEGLPKTKLLNYLFGGEIPSLRNLSHSV